MLAPNPDAIVIQLTSDYRVNTLLMAWSHTLLNTSLYPITPKPAFYDRIAGELAKAKAATQPWLIEKYPAIAAALPQSLVSYGNYALSAIQLLQKELAKANPSRAKVIGWIEGMQASARAQQEIVTGLRDQVAAFVPKVEAVAGEAARQAKEVSAAAGEKNKKVLSLQARISDLQNQLGGMSADAKNAMKGAATTGAGLSMTLMSFTVTAAVGTASFPVFGLVGAFIGLGINAAIQASKSEEVINTIREIGKLALELSAEQNQAAAMMTIARSLETLSEQAGSSDVTMAGSLHHWEDICGELDLLRDLLGLPSLELSQILHLRPARLAAAAAAWTRIVEGASNIQTAQLTHATTIEIEVGAPAGAVV